MQENLNMLGKSLFQRPRISDSSSSASLKEFKGMASLNL